MGTVGLTNFYKESSLCSYCKMCSDNRKQWKAVSALRSLSAQHALAVLVALFIVIRFQVPLFVLCESFSFRVCVHHSQFDVCAGPCVSQRCRELQRFGNHQGPLNFTHAIVPRTRATVSKTLFVSLVWYCFRV